MESNIKNIAYSFGAVATALSYQAFSAYILYFYVDTIKLSAWLASIGMLIWGVFNALNDPLVGFISDRTKSRWGRRIPYILFTALPFGLIYFLVWSPPFDVVNEIALFLYFLIFICLFDLCYTIVVLNWASLFPEMFPSLEERAQVNSYRQSFGMFGLIIGIALPPLIYTTLGWSAMGAIFGALIVSAYYISLWGAKEKEAAKRIEPLGLKESFKHTFINGSFMAFVASNLLIQYAFTMVLAIMPFFAKYILRIEDIKITFIMLATFLSAIIMMFVWRILTIRLSAKRAYLIAILLFAISLLPFFVISNYYLCILAAIFVGATFSGIILISDVLISDIIDEDAVNTKTRREGMYFGTNAFICRFAIALEAASIGFIFISTEYNPVIFSQTKEFLLGLRWLISGLPALALALAFIIMRFYPLDEVKVKWIREQLKS